MLKDVFNLTSTRLSYIVNNTSVRSLVVRTFNFTSIDLANDDTKGLLDALNRFGCVHSWPHQLQHHQHDTAQQLRLCVLRYKLAISRGSVERNGIVPTE